MTVFIGIAGTHSTGKTTFVEAVQEMAQGLGITVAVISDTATKCQDAGFPILRDHTFESTLWIITSVIKAELEAGLKAQLVIVDRPVPDALGYLEAALIATSRSITSEHRSYLYDVAAHHTKRYALLLKTRLDGSIPLGPGRDRDMEFRRSADVCIDDALGKLNAPALDPSTASATDRVRALLDQISKQSSS